LIQKITSGPKSNYSADLSNLGTIFGSSASLEFNIMIQISPFPQINPWFGSKDWFKVKFVISGRGSLTQVMLNNFRSAYQFWITRWFTFSCAGIPRSFSFSIQILSESHLLFGYVICPIAIFYRVKFFKEIRIQVPFFFRGDDSGLLLIC